MNNLFFDEFKNLTSNEKRDLIESYLEKLDIKFEISRIEKFKRNSVELETVILKYDDSEFVFVPGIENVTLGWDSYSDDLGKNVINTLREDLTDFNEYRKNTYYDEIESLEDEIEKALERDDDVNAAELNTQLLEIKAEGFEQDEFDDYLKKFNDYIDENTSKIRTVNISPMIVERDARYITKRMKYKEFISEIEKSDFMIPNEDEWEYLCAGGTRTFLPWGDSLKEELDSIYAMGTVDDDELLHRPNMFGIYISYDSYMIELIKGDPKVKGGDGGSTLCGGDGTFYTVPIFSAFYVPDFDENRSLSENFYVYRRIIHLT